MQALETNIELGDNAKVSGLWLAPPDPRVIYVFAHGAGAGMSHAFMQDVSFNLAEHGVATLRFNFPFMEARSGARWGRTDPPAVAHAAVRAAVAHAQQLAPDAPLFAGGKSFGARITTETHAQEPMEKVCGLVSIGFPLHLAKKPSVARAAHLSRIRAPMLFVQGTRDALADMNLMQQVCAPLAQCKLHTIEGADHAFSVPVRSGRTGADVIREIGETVSRWMIISAGRN
jgi:predicted alpha/beta-hydrolase family hydrolase